MKRGQRWVMVWLVVAACLVVDQVTKTIASNALAGRPSKVFFGGILRLGYVENPGAFLSLGASLPETVRLVVFIALVGVALVAALVFALWPGKTTRAQALALALVAGGGLSNLIDRLLHQGRVIDYMNLGLGPVRTGIFNVADVAITGALVFLLLEGLIWRRKALPDQARASEP